MQCVIPLRFRLFIFMEQFKDMHNVNSDVLHRPHHVVEELRLHTGKSTLHFSLKAAMETRGFGEMNVTEEFLTALAEFILQKTFDK